MISLQIMNDSDSSDLLSMKLTHQELNHTVMKSIIDEISSGSVKSEDLDDSSHSQITSMEEMEDTVLLRPESVETVKNEIQEKNLNTTLMRKGEVVGVVPANLKDLELVRDETGMFKCACCWKVNFIFV